MKVLPMSTVSRNFTLVLPSIIEIHHFERNVKKVDKSTKGAACVRKKKKDSMHLEAQFSSSIWKANQLAWLQWVAFCNIFNPVSVLRSA